MGSPLEHNSELHWGTIMLMNGRRKMVGFQQVVISFIILPVVLGACASTDATSKGVKSTFVIGQSGLIGI
jgi:hypothetical protein